MRIDNLSELQSIESVAFNLDRFLLVKSTQSHYLYANQDLSLLAGYQHPEDLRGRTDQDLKSEAAEYAWKFIEQDKQVITSGHTHHFIDTHKHYRTNPITFLCKKEPVFYKNEVVGIHCDSIKLDETTVSKLYSVLNPAPSSPTISNHAYQTITIKDIYGDYGLTLRESQCLFYIIRGRSNSNIGALLGISPRTVDDYVYNIKTKMQCHTKTHIIEKCITENLTHVLPKGIPLDQTHGKKCTP